MADTPLPRIFFHYGAYSKITTVTLAMQFLASSSDLESVGNDFVLTDASCTAARHGYFDQQTRIWSRAGQLLGVSSQIVWFNVGAEARA
jgi:acyl-CoA thioesterase